MTTQPLDVVYNPLVLDHISEFFSHSSLEDAQALQIERQLREVARVRYEELKNQTRAELVQRLDAFMAGSDVVRTSSALLIYSYTVNKYVRIFCELCSIFPSPTVVRKNTNNEQHVRSYYMLNHRIRGLLFHYKKNCYFAIGFCLFGKSIQKHPDSACEDDVNNEQSFRGYYVSNH